MKKTETNRKKEPNFVALPYQGGQASMTLTELSKEYRSHAQSLSTRVKELEGQRKTCPNLKDRSQIEDRLRILSAMEREARELAVLTERYYERGYRRNAKYTL